MAYYKADGCATTGTPCTWMANAASATKVTKRDGTAAFDSDQEGKPLDISKHNENMVYKLFYYKVTNELLPRARNRQCHFYPQHIQSYS